MNERGREQHEAHLDLPDAQHELRQKQRELRNGAGDAFSAAFEMIVTPAIFGLLGWFLDVRLGLFPVLTLTLAATVLAYEVYKLCKRFNADMDAALAVRRAGYGSDGSGL